MSKNSGRMLNTKNKPVRSFLARGLIFVFCLFGYLPSLNAHPHVWIEVRNAITFDEAQRIVSIEVYWRFDEFYSAFAIQGLDTNDDGKYSPDELTVLLNDNLTEMAKTNYYTQTLVDGKPQSYTEAASPQVSFEDGLLSMSFSLVLTTPVQAVGAKINVSTFDPSYYIALDLAQQLPASLIGEKSNKCQFSIKRPEQSEPVNLDDSIATTNTELARSYALQFTSQILIKCDP